MPKQHRSVSWMVDLELFVISRMHGISFLNLPIRFYAVVVRSRVLGRLRTVVEDAAVYQVGSAREPASQHAAALQAMGSAGFETK